MKMDRDRNPEKFRIRNRNYRVNLNPLDVKSYNQDYYKKKEGKFWENNIRQRYGLSRSDYESMLQSQDGKCAICRSDNPGPWFRRFLVDHDHLTGCVRGLLCGTCNLAIGYLKDDPEMALKALLYLQSHREGWKPKAA